MELRTVHGPVIHFGNLSFPRRGCTPALWETNFNLSASLNDLVSDLSGYCNMGCVCICFFPRRAQAASSEQC